MLNTRASDTRLLLLCRSSQQRPAFLRQPLRLLLHMVDMTGPKKGDSVGGKDHIVCAIHSDNTQTDTEIYRDIQGKFAF